MKVNKWLVCFCSLAIALLYSCVQSKDITKKPQEKEQKNNLEPIIKGKLYTNLKYITNFKDAQLGSFDVSDDEKLVVFSMLKDSNWHIFTKKLDEGLVSQVTSGKSDNIQPKINSSGQKILFLSNRNGTWNIFSIKLSTPSVISPITIEDKEIACPDWLEDDDNIVYSMKGSNGIWKLWIENLTTKTRTLIGPGFCPAYSRFTKKIAFLKESENKYSLWLIAPNGSRLEQVMESINDYHFTFYKGGANKFKNYIAFLKTKETVNFKDYPTLPALPANIWIKDTSGKDLDTQINFDNLPSKHIVWKTKRMYFILHQDNSDNICSIQLLI